jgi:putative spermidine/putrescine transport system ATP-binding protein
MALGDRIVVMRIGAIAQIGSPREVYSAPASRFVAEFIGNANILEATAESGNLVLPGGRLRLANGAASGPAIAMVRPESIGIVEPERAELRGKVDSVSFIGDRQRLIVTGAASRPLLITVASSLEIKVGQRVGLAVEPDSVRLLPGDRR